MQAHGETRIVAGVSKGVSLRGFRGFQIFLWELCVCIKYLSLGDCAVGGGGFLMPTVELLGSRQWKSPCTRHLGRVEAMAPPPCWLL